MAFPTFTLIACVLILILIVTTTLAIIFYTERREAFAYPSKWCYNYVCDCPGVYGSTGYTGATGTAVSPAVGSVAFVNSLVNCKPDPTTGNINLAKCSCLTSGWNAFYDPPAFPYCSGNINTNCTPPGNPPPNFCVS